MTNKTQKIIASDVQGQFLNDISLWNILGNQKSIDKLKIVASQYHTDQSENRAPSYSPILLSGIEGSGRTVMAHAYSNSLGCDKCYVADGSTLAMGGQGIVEFLQQGTEFSSFLIVDAEKLSAYHIHVLATVIKDRMLKIFEIVGVREASMQPWNRLIMFNTKDITQVKPELLNIIDLQLNICDNSTEVIHDILTQRISYLGWKVENTDLLQNIAEVSFETISVAINILSWTYRCARAEGEDVMTAKHVNQALHLMR